MIRYEGYRRRIKLASSWTDSGGWIKGDQRYLIFGQRGCQACLREFPSCARKDASMIAYAKTKGNEGRGYRMDAD